MHKFMLLEAPNHQNDWKTLYLEHVRYFGTKSNRTSDAEKAPKIINKYQKSIQKAAIDLL